LRRGSGGRRMAPARLDEAARREAPTELTPEHGSLPRDGRRGRAPAGRGSGEVGFGEGEAALVFGAGGAAGVAQGGGGAGADLEGDGGRRVASARVERVRRVGEDDERVELGAELDAGAGP